MILRRRRWFGVAAGTVAGGLLATGASAQEKRGLVFEIYADNKGEFRWRLKSSNGQVIGTSGQGYKAKADCRHAIDVIKEDASKAKVEDTTGAK